MSSLVRKRKKETWGFLCLQEPLRLIRDGEVGGREFFLSNTCSLHCHHQNNSALRQAAMWDTLMFHSLCGQSHKTVSIIHNFWWERTAEADRNEVLLPTSIEPGSANPASYLYDSSNFKPKTVIIIWWGLTVVSRKGSLSVATTPFNIPFSSDLALGSSETVTLHRNNFNGVHGYWACLKWWR